MNKAKKLLDRIHGNVFASDTFHSATNNTGLNKVDVHKIPQSWITVHFKTYQRLPKISFKNIKLQNTKLSQVMSGRRSVRQFSGKTISKKELYYLLFQSSRLIPFGKSLDQSRRPYPSAGARYPLEIYPLILHCEGIEKGLYHYNVKEDVLELLLNKNLPTWVNKITNREQWIQKSAVLFIITGVLDRARIKYGDRGYRFALLEAGHVGQNICLLATELGLGSCPIGGYIDDEVNILLDLQLQKEVTLYLLPVGKI